MQAIVLSMDSKLLGMADFSSWEQCAEWVYSYLTWHGLARTKLHTKVNDQFIVFGRGDFTMRVIECEDTGRILWLEWKCKFRTTVCSYSGSDVTCNCGQLFNAWGQRLVDPCLWEEEE